MRVCVLQTRIRVFKLKQNQKDNNNNDKNNQNRKIQQLEKKLRQNAESSGKR